MDVRSDGGRLASGRAIDRGQLAVAGRRCPHRGQRAAHRTSGQLRDYLAALDLSLSPHQYARLTEVSAVSGPPRAEIAFGGEPERFRPLPVPVI
jgi:hypothetical protein